MENFHMTWTATRTRFVNDTITEWLIENSGQKVQITNLGAGVDSRAFWLDSLRQADKYVEVDVESINSFKTKKLAQINAEALCPRQIISMDFMKESIKDLPNHNYDASLPTFWLLEGLVMYLGKLEVIKLL